MAINHLWFPIFALVIFCNHGIDGTPVGTILLYAGGKANLDPNWSICAGQTFSQTDHPNLFSLISQMSGHSPTDDGFFEVPDFSDRFAIGAGQGGGLSSRRLGDTGGESYHTLLTDELPPHKHIFLASSAAASENSPNGNVFAAPASLNLYAVPTPQSLVPATYSSQTGGGMPHDNHPPYVTLNYIICINETGCASFPLGSILPNGGPISDNSWLPCDGALLAVPDYPELSSLLGSTYGGTGSTTFAVPDLSGSSPFGEGTSSLGQVGGTETVALLSSEMPSHNHTIYASASTGDSTVPTSSVVLASSSIDQWLCASGSVVSCTMSPLVMGSSGGTYPHNNLQPFLSIYFYICVNTSCSATSIGAGALIMYPGAEAPTSSWKLCDGSLLDSSQYSDLYAKISTTYASSAGSFVLPDMRGRVPMGCSAGYPAGQMGGAEVHALVGAEIPAHNHGIHCNDISAPDTGRFTNGSIVGFGRPPFPFYSTTVDTTLSASSVSVVGEGKAHNNMAPFLAINFVICSANGGCQDIVDTCAGQKSPGCSCGQYGSDCSCSSSPPLGYVGSSCSSGSWIIATTEPVTVTESVNINTDSVVFNTSVTQTAGSVIQLGISANISGRVVVGEGAVLNGTIEVTIYNTSQMDEGTEYTVPIVEAANITGHANITFFVPDEQGDCPSTQSSAVTSTQILVTVSKDKCSKNKKDESVPVWIIIVVVVAAVVVTTGLVIAGFHAARAKQKRNSTRLKDALNAAQVQLETR